MSKTMIAALLVCIAPAASAQSPVGIVGDPCAGAPVASESIRTYMRAKMDPSAAQPAAPPLAEFAAYQAATEQAKQRDWAGLCHYRADNARLAALPQSERRVVYLGDSITELWAIADPAFFTGGRIDRGISGQTTPQMLLRFQADVVALHPHLVHIMAGTNDIAGNTGPTTTQAIRDNIVAMTTLAKANRIAVVLASTPPAAAFGWRPGLEPAPQIRAHNAWLKDHARAIGARYVDYHALLATPEGGMQLALTTDGVHLNLAGYRRIEAASRAATK